MLKKKDDEHFCGDFQTRDDDHKTGDDNDKFRDWGEELSIGRYCFILLLVPLGSKHHTEKVNPKQLQSP